MNYHHNKSTVKTKSRWVLLAICALGLLSRSALATPEIKGSPDEIRQYLSGIPQTVNLSGSAEKKNYAKQARISLLVMTSSPALADALKKNSAIRKQTRKTLQGLGIKEGSIAESKFTSTPEYGLFSDRPKAYLVRNIMTVDVESEDQFISVADIADNNENIYFLSGKAKMLDKDATYDALVNKALDDVKRKAALYESNLGVRLVPVHFDESFVEAQQRGGYKTMKKSLMSSVSSRGTTAYSIDENTLKVNLLVTYKVLPKE